MSKTVFFYASAKCYFATNLPMCNLEELQTMFAAFKTCFGWTIYSYQGIVRDKYLFNIDITGLDLTTVNHTIEAFVLMMVGEDLPIPEFRFSISEDSHVCD